MTQEESDALFLTEHYRYAHDLANLLFPGHYHEEESGIDYPEDTHLGYSAL